MWRCWDAYMLTQVLVGLTAFCVLRGASNWQRIGWFENSHWTTVSWKTLEYLELRRGLRPGCKVSQSSSNWYIQGICVSSTELKDHHLKKQQHTTWMLASQTDEIAIIVLLFLFYQLSWVSWAGSSCWSHSPGACTLPEKALISSCKRSPPLLSFQLCLTCSVVTGIVLELILWLPFMTARPNKILEWHPSWHSMLVTHHC